METKIKQIVNWIKEETEKANAKGVVIGISGGVDSAVAAALAKKAFPDNVLGLWMGIDSSKFSRRNARRIFEELEIEETRINLKPGVEQFIKDIFELEILKEGDLEAFTKKMNGEKLPRDISYLELKNYQEIVGNIKARLRTATLYAWAQRKNYLVLNTSNLSEIYVGYYTKWADGVGDLAPIAHLSKSEVYELAIELEIPEMVISSNPIADLWADQKSDEEEMGITYKELDDFLAGKEISSAKKAKIQKLHKQNEHKLIGLKKIN